MPAASVGPAGEALAGASAQTSVCPPPVSTDTSDKTEAGVALVACVTAVIAGGRAKHGSSAECTSGSRACEHPRCRELLPKEGSCHRTASAEARMR